MSNCRAKMYPRRILSSFYTKTLHLRYKKPNLGGFRGALWAASTDFLQRGNVFFPQTMDNLALQTKTFYILFEDFMPFLITVCFFLILRITYWIVYFSVTGLLTSIFCVLKVARFCPPPTTPLFEKACGYKSTERWTPLFVSMQNNMKVVHHTKLWKLKIWQALTIENIAWRGKCPVLFCLFHMIPTAIPLSFNTLTPPSWENTLMWISTKLSIVASLFVSFFWLLVNSVHPLF